MNDRDLFIAALQLNTSDERAAYLQQACGTDQERRQRIEKLLQPHKESESFLNPDLLERTAAFHADVAPTTAPTPTEAGGDQIGPFKLLQKLGEGGMGTVWVAEQEKPVKRRVALKVIKAGMDSAQVIRRFEAERQALALMDHTNIAKVLDAGTNASGRPYFVMELVKGVPITKYCDEVHASIESRLDLFVQVCSAVQHAHQKGIIHRDIKPSNILIAMQDGKPVPKVIDFGVAKALHSKLADKTMYTEIGQIIGTLEYMAPEQAELSAMDIDTRADIYALGVLLYELLTGSTPITRERMKSAAFAEVIRLIKEEDPPKPSTRLTDSKESLANLAALRKTDPKRLSSVLKGELDWVVLKALEKDRTCRYETANGLARDIQRYLADEVVEARPASVGYRLRKFVHRNRELVWSVMMLFCVLSAGIAGTTYGLVKANSMRIEAESNLQLAHDRADGERKAKDREAERAEGERLAKLDALAKQNLAVAAADKERAARLEEERQRKFAEAITRFVHDDFLALTSVDGQERFGGADKKTLDRNTTLGQLLDRAAEKLRARKDLDPRIEAKLCWIIGVNYRGAGESSKGIDFLERAVKLRTELLGRDHADTLDAMNSLAIVYDAAGKLDLALPLFVETLKLRKAKLGLNHPDTLMGMNNLAGAYQATGKMDLALPLFEEALKLQKAELGPTHRDTLISMNNLATAYKVAGKLDLALPLYEETFKLMKAKLGPDHSLTLAGMNNLAAAYHAGGQFDKTVPLCVKVLKLKETKLGADHPDTIASMNNLAQAYLAAGQLAKGLPLMELTLEKAKAILGPDHPNTLSTTGRLAAAYQAAGQLDKALPLMEVTFEAQKAKLGPDHPSTLISLNNLALAYQSLDKFDRSVALFEEAFKLRKAKLGPDHPRTRPSMNNLAVGYQAAGKLDLALPLLEESLQLLKTKRGSDHPSTLNGMISLATGYHAAKNFDLALPLFEETLPLMKAKLGADHPKTLVCMNNMAMAYRDAGKFDVALPLLEESHQRLKAKLGPNHPTTLSIMTNLATIYRLTKHGDQAASVLKELVAAQRKRLPMDSPQLAGMLAQVSLDLLQCDQFPLAEEILRECLAIREKKEPDAWSTFNTQSLLGAALLGQKKYAEAEPLLLKGYEGMKARLPTPGADAARLSLQQRLPEALDRLIQLYAETNKPDEVKKLQAEKDKLPKPAEKK